MGKPRQRPPSATNSSQSSSSKPSSSQAGAHTTTNQTGGFQGNNQQEPIYTGVHSNSAQDDQSLTEHLIELRNRLLICMIAIAVPLLPLFAYIKPIYTAMLYPFTLTTIPDGAVSTINTGVVSPTAAPIKIIMVLSIIIAIPIILHQLWRFIAPGLYKSEKALAAPLLLSTVFLFYCGMAFAYFALVPAILNFSYYFAELLGQNWQPEVGDIISFLVTQFLLVGMAFEVPVATFLLVKAGIITVERLKKSRAYVLLGVLVLGMVLTPPDVFSQILLAAPMYALYELGILVSWLFIERKQSTTE